MFGFPKCKACQIIVKALSKWICLNLQIWFRPFKYWNFTENMQAGFNSPLPTEIVLKGHCGSLQGIVSMIVGLNVPTWTECLVPFGQIIKWQSFPRSNFKNEILQLTSHWVLWYRLQVLVFLYILFYKSPPGCNFNHTVNINMK